MSITITETTRSFLEQTTRADCYCIRIERRDNVVYTFTTAPREIQFNSSPIGVVPNVETYTPIQGVNATAVEKAAGLREDNIDLFGLLDVSAIDEVDLRGGLLDGAKVQIFTVPQLYPFLGPLIEEVFWVESTVNHGDTWEARLSGISHFLQNRIGGTLGPRCPYTVGEGKCITDATGLTATRFANMSRTGVEVLTVGGKPRQWFFADPATLAEAGVSGEIDIGDNYFVAGRCEWTVGDNAGVISEVAQYEHASRLTKLRMNLPHAIQVGDECNLFAGCDKVFTTCIGKFNNKVNFGGDHLMGTIDDALRGPLGS